MNKSIKFKLAHLLAKAVKKDGDNYAVTFGAALKIINSIHNITGSDKQLAWADRIIADIFSGIVTAQSNLESYFFKCCTDVRALPLLNAITNKGVAHFIIQYLSMSLNELIAVAKNHSYKTTKQAVCAHVVKTVQYNIKKTEVKRSIKLIK